MNTETMPARSARVTPRDDTPEAVFLPAMPAGTELLVETQRSRYRVILVDPGERAVQIQGGRAFAAPKRAVIVGATPGYGYLKSGWITAGLSMEILADDRCHGTSAVRRILAWPRDPEIPGSASASRGPKPAEPSADPSGSAVPPRP